MANYLLEIGTEEIPAKFMPGVLNQLQELAAKKLEERRIKYEKLETMGTPRRITLLVQGLARKGEDQKEEVRGPSVRAAFDPAGNVTKAAEGFARSQGVAVESLVVKDLGTGEYVYALKEIQGQETREALPEIAVQLIGALSFPKPMRWGSKEMRFARPIRWLVSLLDDEIIPFELEGLTADRITRGHRFLGQESVVIKSPLTYIQQLQENFVSVRPQVRREECWSQIQAAAQSIQGEVEADEELLEEVTYLLEWPTALVGSFDPGYLEIPEEVVITPMREHQRYFPVRGKDGNLQNRFITIRNGNAEHLDVVRSGNEKVLNARLADARFFWDEDRKTKLSDYLPRLEKIVFQESLGTVAQKIDRIAATTRYLARVFQLAEDVKANAERAARLAKADLVTNMVYEFPELQGIMGHYYAQLSGEPETVAQAILEHYQPRYAGDKIPAGMEGALVSIADKMDTIAGCFAIGIEPTGSQDPYALRRQAMGVCLVIIGQGLEIKLDDLMAFALDNYRGILSEEALGSGTRNKIREFFQARLRNILTDEGHRYDVVDAVLCTDYSSLLGTLARARALTEMKDNSQFRDLLISFIRAYNLSKKAENTTIDPGAFVEQAEKDLYAVLEDVKGIVKALEIKKDFVGIIRELSRLAGPINSFFNAVMVMAEDPQVRSNRLGLLSQVVDISRSVGDLSKIVL